LVAHSGLPVSKFQLGFTFPPAFFHEFLTSNRFYEDYLLGVQDEIKRFNLGPASVHFGVDLTPKKDIPDRIEQAAKLLEYAFTRPKDYKGSKKMDQFTNSLQILANPIHRVNQMLPPEKREKVLLLGRMHATTPDKLAKNLFKVVNASTGVYTITNAEEKFLKDLINNVELDRASREADFMLDDEFREKMSHYYTQVMDLAHKIGIVPQNKIWNTKQGQIGLFFRKELREYLKLLIETRTL
jgi:hypothetical protein